LELVFCCPQCLHISSTGITTNSETLARAQHRPILVTCRTCRRLNYIMVADALITSSFGSDGTFASFDLHDLDNRESEDQPAPDRRQANPQWMQLTR
jgi:hypothetical protein